MIYAYFGGMGVDKRSCYELLLEHTGFVYRVTSEQQAQPTVEWDNMADGLWRWRPRRRNHVVTKTLYTGREARRALLTLLQTARAANLGHMGQRFCYVLPSVPNMPGNLGVVLSPHLRHDGSLPFHPQLWQVGRTLDLLPVERQMCAATDIRVFGDEQVRWKLA